MVTKRLTLEPMTAYEVSRGVRMRRYSWGKSVAEIAAECGLSATVIRDVLCERPFSAPTHARLVGYLRTPAGSGELGANEYRRRSAGSGRWPLYRRLAIVKSLAVRYDFPVQGGRQKHLSNAELQAYVFNIEDAVRKRLLARYGSRGRLRLWDRLPLWRWIELLEAPSARARDAGPARA